MFWLITFHSLLKIQTFYAQIQDSSTRLFARFPIEINSDGANTTSSYENMQCKHKELE